MTAMTAAAAPSVCGCQRNRAPTTRVEGRMDLLATPSPTSAVCCWRPQCVTLRSQVVTSVAEIYKECHQNSLCPGAGVARKRLATKRKLQSFSKAVFK